MTLSLTGLTGLAGYQQQIDNESQATPEERSGGTADPRHGIRGEQARPYPWESKATQAATAHGPYGPANQMLGDEQWFYEIGGEEWQDPAMDHTPSHRAGPFPKGVASGQVPGETPDDIAEQLRQSAMLHSINTNAGIGRMTSIPALNDEWQENYNIGPGNSDLQPLPKQAMSSGFMWGTRDRIQSMARQNEYGFDSAHTHRRYAVGSIPGNTMWLKPGGRPLAKSLPGPARPAIGLDSPFTGHDLGASFGIGGAMLQTVPPEYTPPPQPNLASASDRIQTNNSVVEFW